MRAKRTATARQITVAGTTYTDPFPATAGSPYRSGTWLVTAADADDPKGFITVARRDVLAAFGITPRPADAILGGR